MTYLTCGSPLPIPSGRVRTIPLQAELLPGGKVRISSPLARGWAGVAANPHQLADVIAKVFTEVTVASVARWRNQPYDQDSLTMQVAGDPLAAGPQARRRTRTQARRNTGHRAYSPEAWTCMTDGNWRSPSGRMYRGDSAVVQRVKRKLERRDQAS